ncbi:hypothetical protein D3C72_1644530 [compost metagenome]
MIVTGLQLAGVFDGDIQVAGRRIVVGVGNAALTDGRRAVDVIEQRRTEIAVLIQALTQLFIDLIGHDHGNTPQVVDGGRQHFAAIAQQPTHLATAHHAGDVDRRTATIHDDR